MISNLDRYKKDLDALITSGERLELSLKAECYPDEMETSFQKALGDKGKAKELMAGLPKFKSHYQQWYSEAKTLIKQLLSDRLDDFVRHYEKPKSRKSISFENYRIEDCLQGLILTRGLSNERVVGPDAAIPHMAQQIAMLKAVKARFESSLFDIRQLVMADLFDSELEAAKELAKNKFWRAAGAMAGVVLEKHLRQVCSNHGVAITKKAPGISDLNELLKAANVIDVPQWRFHQHLADIRNLCDHSKSVEPTAAQVEDLIAGVAKVVKTIF